MWSTWFFVGGAALLAIAGGAVFFGYRQGKKNAQITAVQDQNNIQAAQLDYEKNLNNFGSRLARDPAYAERVRLALNARK